MSCTLVDNPRDGQMAELIILKPDLVNFPLLLKHGFADFTPVHLFQQSHKPIGMEAVEAKWIVLTSEAS